MRILMIILSLNCMFHEDAPRKLNFRTSETGKPTQKEMDSIAVTFGAINDSIIVWDGSKELFNARISNKSNSFYIKNPKRKKHKNITFHFVKNNYIGVIPLNFKFYQNNITFYLDSCYVNYRQEGCIAR